jgi:hypothetical protein
MFCASCFGDSYRLPIDLNGLSLLTIINQSEPTIRLSKKVMKQSSYKNLVPSGCKAVCSANRYKHLGGICCRHLQGR